MPPVKVKTLKEKLTPGEIVRVDPGTKVVIEKQPLPLIVEFEQSLLRLGIDLATGMYDKTRFPSTQEVAGLDALCKLYGTLKGYHGN